MEVTVDEQKVLGRGPGEIGWGNEGLRTLRTLTLETQQVNPFSVRA